MYIPELIILKNKLIVDIKLFGNTKQILHIWMIFSGKKTNDESMSQAGTQA